MVNVKNYNCSDQDVLFVEKNVVKLESQRFVNVHKIKEVVFEEGSICYVAYGFNKFYNLEKIHFPKSMKYIKGFNKCEKLKEVTFEDGIELEEINGFKNCDKLEKIIIPKNAHVGYDSFNDCLGLKSVIIENGIRRISLENVFNGLRKLEEVVIARNVEKIEYSFCNCNNLSKIIINDGSVLKYISGFQGPNKIKSFFVLKNVTFLNAFDNNNVLEKITFEEGSQCKTFIGIKRCTKLTEVFIPKSVEIYRVIDGLSVFEEGSKFIEMNFGLKDNVYKIYRRRDKIITFFRFNDSFKTHELNMKMNYGEYFLNTDLLQYIAFGKSMF